MQTMKKVLSFFLVFVLLFSSVLFNSFAEIDFSSNVFKLKAKAATTGTCGENLTWTLDDEGTLTISGTGDMDNYSFDGGPWHTTSIKQVILEPGMTSIGDGAFYNHNKVTSIIIPDTVTTIGERAFAYCSSLYSITIPAGVESIGGAAFAYCLALRSITFEENSQLTSISEHMFEDCALTSIEIPDHVESIGDNAFWDCYDLSSVSVPSSLKSVGVGAFRYTTSLKNVYYSDTAENWAKITISDANGYLLNATIHYAKDSTTDLHGDTNGDGQITSADARLALRASVGLENLTGEQILAADVDKDGKVTSADARLILRASVGLENLE